MSDGTVTGRMQAHGFRRGGKAVLVMAGILALGLTAGCGKKDDPEPPGPNPTYPKTYPTS